MSHPAGALHRFLAAQSEVYRAVLAELRAGTKRSHWMWFVFPQLAGLGRSPTARHYALTGLAEAQAYAGHAILGSRLRECTDAMLGWAGRRDAARILGEVDALKFASSMTLFAAACRDEPRFPAALSAFYEGRRDQATLDLLAAG